MNLISELRPYKAQCGSNIGGRYKFHGTVKKDEVGQFAKVFQQGSTIEATLSELWKLQSKLRLMKVIGLK
ncbi:hypothetical protein Bca4012_065866 [Brassica carinata]